MENRTKVLQVKGNSYEVTYPTIKQIMDIEGLKITLSKGKYKEYVVQGTSWSIRALDLIDMCSYLSVMCPKLIIDLKVDIINIDYLDAEELMKVFSEQFLPWWGEYQDIVNKRERGE